MADGSEKEWSTPTSGGAHVAYNSRNEPILEGMAREWPTPCAGTNRKSARAMERSVNNGRRSGGGQSSSPGLEQVAEIQAGQWPKEVPREAWPTPNARISQDGEDPTTWLARREELKKKGYNSNGAGTPLTIASLQWPTPTAGDHKAAGSRNTPNSKANKGVSLTDAAVSGNSEGRQWPTPRALTGGAESAQRKQELGRHEKGANSSMHCLETGGGRKHMDQLANFAVHHQEQTPAWTPCPDCENYLCNIHAIHAHECPCPSIEEWDHSPYLPSPPAPATTGEASPSSSTQLSEKRRLNPTFVEWLMGFPIWWTLPSDTEPIG